MKTLPKSFLQASATTTERKEKVLRGATKVIGTAVDPEFKKVEARIDMSAEVAGKGLCPECNQPMSKVLANGIPVYQCQEHRIAIPLKDEEVAEG